MKNKEKRKRSQFIIKVDMEDSLSQIPSVRDRYGLNLPSDRF